MDIPKVGLGTYKATDPALLKAAVKMSIEECGYKHIDCASYYQNQTTIGEALSEILFILTNKTDLTFNFLLILINAIKRTLFLTGDYIPADVQVSAYNYLLNKLQTENQNDILYSFYLEAFLYIGFIIWPILNTKVVVLLTCR